MKASRRQGIYLGFVGSLISIKLSMRSSILFCFKPMRNSRTWFEGAEAMCSHPWGISGQACFKARLSQRFRRVLDVPSCTSPRTRKEDQSILGKKEEVRFKFEQIINSYLYDNRTKRTTHFLSLEAQKMTGKKDILHDEYLHIKTSEIRTAIQTIM